MREALRRRLMESGAEEKLRRQEELRRREKSLTRELEEVSGRIPFWDRMVFFSRTADEQREKGLSSELRGVRSERGRLDREVSASLEKAQKEFPPFAVGTELEEARRLALEARDRAAATEVGRRLEALGARVRGTWTPDFDAEKAARTIARELSLRAAAAAAREVPGEDDRFGRGPVAGRDLTCLVARRLLDGGFLQELARRDTLRDEAGRLEKAAQEAAGRVTLGAKLNVFTDSPAEKERDRLRLALGNARREIGRWEADVRERMHAGLAVYPPLAFHSALLEAAAVASSCLDAEEDGITDDGQLGVLRVLSGRPLLLASLERCVREFHAAFPGFPMPSEAARELAGEEARPAVAPSEGVIATALDRIAAGPAPGLLDEALAAAAAAAGVAHQETDLARSRPLWSRLGLWGDPGVDRVVDRLDERRKEWEERARSCRQALETAAASAANALVPFRVRDAILRSLVECGRIATEGGETSYPRSCSVYHREDTLRALGGANAILSAEYGVEGDESSMIDRAVSAGARDPGPLGDPERLFRRLDVAGIAGLVAHRLLGTGFHEAARQYREASTRQYQVGREKSQVQDQVSFWDRVNIFTTTPAEKRLAELGDEEAAVLGEASAAWSTLSQLFGQGLDAFPPARLFFLLHATESAVRAIHAVSRTRHVTVHHGKSSHTETRYYCALRGKDAADHALRGAASYFQQTFGRLPGTVELLERWVRERLA